MSMYENAARAAAYGQRVYWARCSDEKIHYIGRISFRNVPE